ncbi:cytochrome c [Paraflavitalea soli]|uniref:Cytochrome c n=1 Tax=Paraflavitalea soli TaxID=2315862 RepID=A0A3B7MZE2_9BACT|nr:cytochrome c [Paraflavitalea soli]AXY78446.1 cytochrome c [Paraflavitalea soli]
MKPLIATITGSLITVLLLSFIVTGQKAGPGKTGQELFEKHCKQCHGKDGTRGLFGAKNLQTSQLADEALYTTIARGRKIMPAWEKRMDSAELGLVVAYVKTLRK